MRKRSGPNIRGVYRGPAVARFLRLGEQLKNALMPDVPPTEEGWWIEVLFDNRARWPQAVRLSPDDPYAYLRLDRFKKATLVLRCDRCKVRREYQRNELIRGYGGDFNRVVLRFKLQPCPSQHSDAVFDACRLDFE